MKIEVGLYIKKLFWQLSWGEDYKEKIKEISKTKKVVTVFSVCLFDAEQYVISTSQRNKTFWLVILLILVNYYW